MIRIFNIVDTVLHKGKETRGNETDGDINATILYDTMFCISVLLYSRSGIYVDDKRKIFVKLSFCLFYSLNIIPYVELKIIA